MPKKEKERLFTLRLPESIANELDSFKTKSGLSRQKLIERILRQVLADRSFVLKDK